MIDVFTYFTGIQYWYSIGITDSGFIYACGNSKHSLVLNPLKNRKELIRPSLHSPWLLYLITNILLKRLDVVLRILISGEKSSGRACNLANRKHSNILCICYLFLCSRHPLCKDVMQFFYIVRCV